ncbi:hypothetical protein quinque_014845 [Culex quinquefasciatus]
MSSTIRRVNTFKIDFASLPKKPRFEEIHHFVKTTLGIPKEKIERLQVNHYFWCVFVKCVDLATAQQTVLQHNNKHAFEIDGKKYTIKIQMEDGAVDVRLHDLPEEITNDQVKKFMSAYGEILSVRELVWEEKYELTGLKTGVREVKMILKHQIKSFISIEGQHTYVTYIGQQTTCRHCGEIQSQWHPCTQNKKLLLQKVSVNERLKDAKKPTGKSSYADALMTKPSPRFVPAVLVEDNTARIIIQDGGSSGDANGLADMRQKTTPILQETIIRDGDQLCVFKTPLTLPQDGDGAEESDGSSTSSASGKRPRGRPPKIPKTST